MAYSLNKILNALNIFNSNGASSIEITPTGTGKTTLTSDASTDVAILLPTTRGRVATEGYVNANNGGGLEIIQPLSFATPSTLTTLSKEIVKITDISLGGGFSNDAITYDLYTLTAASQSNLTLNDGEGSADYYYALDDGFTQLTNAVPSNSVVHVTGVSGAFTYHDIRVPDVTTIPLGWTTIVKDVTTGGATYNGVYTSLTNTIFYDDTVKETVKVKSVSVVDNSAAGWLVLPTFQIKLPDVTTLALNRTFSIKNTTASTIGFYTFTGYATNTILTQVPAGKTISLKAISTVDNSAAGWQVISDFYVKLPDVTAINLGKSFIVDNTTANYNVKVFSVTGYNTLAPIVTIQSNRRYLLTSVSTSVNTDAGWELRDIDFTTKEDSTLQSIALTNGGLTYLTKNNSKRILCTYAVPNSASDMFLPDVSTLHIGRAFSIKNSSVSSSISVATFAANSVQIIEAGEEFTFTALSISNNTAAGWEVKKSIVSTSDLSDSGRLVYTFVNAPGANVQLQPVSQYVYATEVAFGGDYSLIMPNPDLMIGKTLYIINGYHTPFKVKHFGGGSVSNTLCGYGAFKYEHTADYSMQPVSVGQVIEGAALNKSDFGIDNLYVNGLTGDMVPYTNSTTKKLTSSAISSTKLGYLTDVTSNIQAQINALGGGGAINIQESLSSGSFTSVAPTNANVTNLTVTITTTGGPVHVGLQSATAAAGNHVGITNAAGPDNIGMNVFFLRGGVQVNASNLAAGVMSTANNALYSPPSAFGFIDTGLAAGTYTYTVQVTSLLTVRMINVKLVAHELK